MKKTLVLVLILLSCLFASLPVRSSFANQTIDKILVVVNDEIITDSDLEAVVAPVITRMRSTLTGQELDRKIQEAREFYLNKMIEDLLLTSAARELKFEVEETEIDEMINDVRKRFPSQQAYEQVLRDQGMSFKKLRDRFRNELLKQKAIDFKVRSRINVSPGEIKAYYDAHPGEFQGTQELQVRQILIRTGDSRSDEAAQEIAQSLVKRIELGDDMETLATQFSEDSQAEKGGSLGWVKKGQFMERLDREIFKLKKGEVSQPIKSSLGYHVFKIEDVKDAVTQSFEEVQAKIQKQLYDGKTEILLKEWLEELKLKSYVSYQGAG